MVSLCVLGIHKTTGNAQQNMGTITETLVDLKDLYIFIHFMTYEYESRTFAFVPHDFLGYPLLRYLKAVSLFERLSCFTKRFQLTTEFT
jgi:hypothetical protein